MKLHLIFSLPCLFLSAFSCAPGSPSDAGVSDAAIDPADALVAVFDFTIGGTEEGVLDDRHACGGQDLSPPFQWENPPDESASFGISLVDRTIAFNHSVIWNIAGDTRSIDEGIENAASPANVPGASQAAAWNGVQGYAGPCPPNQHEYVFTLYALDTETLDIDDGATRQAVTTALQANAIDSKEVVVLYGE